jgi:phospho-N-acetylmuramoyl-pentapeptide-transferase
MNYLFFFGGAAAVFLCTFLILKKLIPVLRSHKIGQKINEIGPRWHKNKEGTPIMGGVAFIIPAAVLNAAGAAWAAAGGSFSGFLPTLLTFVMSLLSGGIGFVDDYTKLIKKQNEGLKAWQKLSLQLAVAAAYVAAMSLSGFTDTRLELPFCGAEVELGAFYYIFCVLLIAGMDNAVNITDGIDGLCGSVTAIVAVLFGVFALVRGDSGLALFAGTVLGGCAGFLMYNFYPARIFMGDTGSLYLGGAVVGMAFLAGEPLIVLICGILYICEIMSVVLQVVYFKLTHGKRLFKIAPIHHHFERCGWNEIRIVCVFSAVTLLGCIAAWFGLTL